MRVEIVEAAADPQTAETFPPCEDFVDLRGNLDAVDQIAAARHHLPLRNFLISVNSPESIFATSGAGTKSDAPATVPGAGAYEFASQAGIVFAVPFFNWEPGHYTNLCSGLKELLERDSADAVRAVLKISRCQFTEESRMGYCLGIRLVAEGNSSEQAELRWGLGLARVQQAALFLSRAMKQHMFE